ncbi:SH3 domain-containing protein [Ruegeria profundi]|uniref:SH3 domain-containing protein n=1 Tax=Ruegeria profundi TaxID=1685378 RepID=UPI0009E85C82|nr:SH3 domain-containing protein [Ruegeria profundi]
MKLFKTITLIAALAMATGASAQLRTEEVRFASGTSGATIPGRIVGSEEVRYELGASAGQSMRVDLATSNSSAYFNIFAPGDVPGQSEALFVGPVSGTSYAGILPESGTYTIQVFLNRNAARRGEQADYRLTVSIGGAAAPATDYADSLAGGPDWWAVTGVSGRLNVRSGPSTSNSVVTTVPRGFVLRNMGCTDANGRWCRVEAPDGRFIGWVAGRFLAESGGPVATSQQPTSDFANGLSGGPDWWAVTGVSRGDTLNVRSGPSTSNRVVARVPNGYVMRNLGCVQRSQRWCEVEAPDGGFEGWVAGRFLRESSRPSSANVAPANSNTRPGRPQGAVPTLFQRDTGEFEVAWSSGCQVLFSPTGREITAGSTCSGDQRARSRDAVERYRREQGQSPASSGAVPTPVGGMQAYCLGAAAGHFQTAVPLLETDRPLNLGNQYVVTGRFKNNPVRAFRCQFDRRGVFQGVYQ